MTCLDEETGSHQKTTACPWEGKGKWREAKRADSGMAAPGRAAVHAELRGDLGIGDKPKPPE